MTEPISRGRQRARCVARAFVLTALAGSAACHPAPPQPVERTIKLKDQIAVIRVASSDAPYWQTVYESTARTMKRVDDALGTQSPNSDISRLNRVGSDARIQISHDTFRLLDIAQHYSELSGGAFDFTVAPLAYLWGFEGGPLPTNAPSQDMLQVALTGIGVRNLALFENGAAALTRAQAKVSVDSLADAYAADMALVEARDKAVANAFVQIGRSARALGASDAGDPWQMPLADPFQTNGTLGRLLLDGRIAMSQALLREKTVTIGGKIYGHIIDPRTGSPAEGTALAAASGPSATKCSVLAQALIVAGVGGAPQVLARFSKCEALLVPDRKPLEIWMTHGFAPHVKLNPELQGAVKYIEVVKSAEPVKDDDAPTATNSAAASPPPAAK